MRKRTILDVHKEGFKIGKNNQPIVKRQRTLFEFDIPTAPSLRIKSTSNKVVQNDIEQQIIISDNDEFKETIIDIEEVIETENKIVDIDVEEDHIIKEEILESSNNSNEMIEINSSQRDHKVVLSSQDNSDIIICPMCNKNISDLEIYERDTHAEICYEKSFNEKKVKKTIVKKQINKKIRKPLKELPDFKIIKFKDNLYKVIIDGFNYREDISINKYFLSHFHSDHYIGMKKSWNKGDVYCSKVTERLIRHKFNIKKNENSQDKEVMNIIGLNNEQTYWVYKDKISVKLIDANHCPGASIFLFQQYDDEGYACYNVLHTGDFRANDEMINKINKILGSGNSGIIDEIFLDTTYLIPNYDFPDQSSVIDNSSKFFKEYIRKDGIRELFGERQKNIFEVMGQNISMIGENRRVLFLVGTYSIGKEKLAIGIANKIGSKIYCNERKREIIDKYSDEIGMSRILGNNKNKCMVHLVSMNVLKNQESIDKYVMMELGGKNGKYEEVIGIIPTGWTFENRWKAKVEEEEIIKDKLKYVEDVMKRDDTYNIDKLKKQYKFGRKYQIFRVPYSEHSSFKEIIKLLRGIRWRRIIPTVNLDRIEEMREWISTAVEKKENKIKLNITN